MRVVTKAYGEMDVDERQRVVFPEGILGFEELKDYALLDASQPPFYWLQSLDRPEVAFVLIDPRVFRPDYSAEIDPEELAEIGVTAPDDALTFAIVTIPEDSRRMTANLQGPVILNKKSRIGRQFISASSRWGIRHLILEELAVARQASC
jgi:flagellar assembly factor FliW